MDPNPDVPPIISEPPLPSEVAPPEPAPKGPWAFWATLGWSGIIGGCWIGIQLIVLAAYIIGWMVIQRSQTPPTPSDIEQLMWNGTFFAVATIASGAAGVALSILFIRLRRGPSIRDYLGWHPARKRDFFAWIAIFLLIAFTGDYVTYLLDYPVVPEEMVDMFQASRFSPLLWIAVVVAAPVCEEVFFRGFLFRGLQSSRLGGWGTIIVTAVWWAVIHLQYNVLGMLIIFLYGIVLGLARLKTGSLMLCMTLHAINNFVATVQALIFE